ncbi:hypothetical protein [Kitasatospora sp. NPDC058046]|uniref:hypothetical protein n=1 Tax=Kitasatospora sp. NPDC058046 TaxID=3346312 RepID=UPI0036D8DE21
MFELVLRARRYIRYFPHMLVIIGGLTAGPMVKTHDLAASFPRLLAPIAVVAVGVILAFVFPPHGRRRR